MSSSRDNFLKSGGKLLHPVIRQIFLVVGSMITSVVSHFFIRFSPALKYFRMA